MKNPIEYCNILVKVVFDCLFDDQGVRSNFNSRGVNRRELFGFGGHSSESSGAFLTKIKGHLLPDLSKPKN